MEKFIYVFSKEARDELRKRNYALLKASEEKDIYVFLNTPERRFEKADFQFVLSDTLTF